MHLLWKYLQMLGIVTLAILALGIVLGRLSNNDDDNQQETDHAAHHHGDHRAVRYDPPGEG